MGVVYLTTCCETQKSYVGRTIQTFRRRKTAHKLSAKNNSQTAFHKAIRKYGWDSFSWAILFESDDVQSLAEAEEQLISAWETFGAGGYNMSAGGESGTNGYKHTEEAKRKISRTWKGKKRSAATRKKMSEWQIGRKLPPSTVEKMSKAMMGKPGWNKGVPMSEEAKRKLSQSLKGRILSSETKAKMSKVRKGKPKNKEWRAKIKASNIRTRAIRTLQKIAEECNEQHH